MGEFLFCLFFIIMITDERLIGFEQIDSIRSEWYTRGVSDGKICAR